MKLKFKRIGVIAKPSVPKIEDTLNNLFEYLSSISIPATLDEGAAEQLSLWRYPTASAAELASDSDLIVVVGGDGSFLNAGRWAVDAGTPVVGINRGRLGFLTDIHPQDIPSSLGSILEGNYFSEKRYLLEASLIRGDNVVEGNIALNDVVLYSGEIARMIEFEVWVDKHFVCRQRSDGIIVSSPTGSTAYALSGGGPIIHPRLNALLLVPMHPHTLSSRPIVLDGGAQIELRIVAGTDHLPHVSCDGQIHLDTEYGDAIAIRRHEKPLTLIHPNDHEFFAVLRNKLGWGSER